jgi:hypothetical protein
MAANELLVNTRNKKRVERELPEEIVAHQAALGCTSEAEAILHQRRAEALERLQRRAEHDMLVHDLLLVLGVVPDAG